jgi:SET domain-containing protein
MNKKLLVCDGRFGYGVFATKRIEKGEFITEYDGNVICRDQAIRLRKAGLSTHIASIDYHYAIDGILEPDKEGTRGIGSLCNHSEDPKTQNAYLFKSDSNKINQIRKCTRTGYSTLTRVWLRAKRDIEPGEEIMYSYGKKSIQLDHPNIVFRHVMV